MKLPFTDEIFVVVGDDEDASSFRTIKEGNLYDPHLTALMSRLVKPTDTCFDVGANIGVFSVTFSRLTQQGRVVAFEALESHVEMLKETLSINKCENVEVVHAAISDKKDSLTIVIDSDYHAGAYISLDSGGESVVATTIDDWVSENQLAPDVVKVDVEGWELDCLRGMQRTMRQKKPLMLVEFNPIATRRVKDSSLKPLWKLLLKEYPIVLAVFADSRRRVLSWSHLKLLMREQGLCDLLCLPNDDYEIEVPSYRNALFNFLRLMSQYNVLMRPKKEYVTKWRYRLSATVPPTTKSNTIFESNVRLRNLSSFWLDSERLMAVNLAYQWIDSQGKTLERDSSRTSIGTIRPFGKGEVVVKLTTPSEPGKYQLRFSLVQEGQSWAYQVNSDLDQRYSVEVL